jgi:hypothetical protein
MLYNSDFWLLENISIAEQDCGHNLTKEKRSNERSEMKNEKILIPLDLLGSMFTEMLGIIARMDSSWISYKRYELRRNKHRSSKGSPI